MRRNVFINRGAYHVWPNQYVFLIAKSGGCKKSGAMELGMDLIDTIKEIHTVGGKMTTEGLMDTMNRATIDPNGVVKPDGSILIQADELAYLFGKSAYVGDLITFLTAAYTGKSKLDFLTRNKGLCQVRNPCPSILAGSTPEQLGEIFPTMTLASGFMARVLLVYGERGIRVPKPEVDRSMEDALIHDLGCIAKLHGEVQLTQEADDMFDKWYMSLDDKVPPKDLESFYERKHDHVLKTALVMSVAESDNMIITIEHLASALAAIDNIEHHLPAAIAHIGSTQQANAVDFAENMIRSVYPESMGHSVLLRRMYKRLTYGKTEMDELISMLEGQGKIKITADRSGVRYTAILDKK
jgi:hypothetical protein